MEMVQLCSHPVVGWQDAPLGIFQFVVYFRVATQFEPEVILLAVGW